MKGWGNRAREDAVKSGRLEYVRPRRRRDRTRAPRIPRKLVVTLLHRAANLIAGQTAFECSERLPIGPDRRELQRIVLSRAFELQLV